ncbi:MAG: hypothetical protein EBZ47_09675 [Chlamydiae bacterium]|nr:hypothetical protein [Chlamydiota bacterium]
MTKVAILTEKETYDASYYMAKSLAKAFTRKGIEVLVVEEFRQDIRSTLQSVQAFLPSFTLSFADIALEKGGPLLCDLLELPHFAYLVDPTTCYYHLCKSPWTVLSTIEPTDKEVLCNCKRMMAV